MKKAITLLSFFTFLTMLAAQDHIVTLSGIAFSPNNLTINAGETVQWSNTGGTHNVNGSAATYPGNPEAFMSGGAMPAPWMFSHTFNTPGFYQYRCDPHFSLGMTGTITVTPAAANDVVITEINYNNPGTDSYEFIELYNKGTAAVQLEGWTFSSAIAYTFPSYSLAPGGFVVVANDSAAFATAFGFSPLGWNAASNNVLNNTGENIVLNDASGMVVDSVHYADMAPWPTGPDGFGPSLVLCDLNSDNGIPANWSAAITPTGVVVSGIEILANPGAASGCVNGPLLSFQFSNFNIQENAGNVLATVILTNGNANPTAVTLAAAASSTATFPDDYSTMLPVTLTFPGGVAADTQVVSINIVDDTDIESNEVLNLVLTNATNGATVVGSGLSYNITDNDAPLSGALLISGVFDAQPGAAGAKGIELKALQAIPDLSIYGIGSASNGGGSDGEEITLPAGSLMAGECVYIAADSALFATYFGFAPLVSGQGANINGDDAIELFENGQVIDVYGDITYPAGTGGTLAWNYLDGWAYRKDGTGPDATVFNLNNWTVAAGVLIGGTNNATAPTPFPVCDYSTVAPMTAELVDDNFVVSAGVASNLNVLANDVLPVAITSLIIVSGPAHGTIVGNGIVDFTYTPTSGYCGSDVFTYQVCDAGGCDQATVNITVECYPLYNIGDVTKVTNGQPDSVDVTCELRGIVYGIDFQGVSAAGATLPAVQFYLRDGTGTISIFGTESFGYSVQEGDEVAVKGRIMNFNCLTQMSDLNSLTKVSSGNTLVPPAITTFLNESLESDLVQFTNMALVDPSAWVPAGTGFNVMIKSTINTGATPIAMRIDNDCELFNMPAPVGAFHAIGLVSQFVSGGAGGCVDGYQILPRYAADIILLNATNESYLANKISFYPNPVSDQLFLKTDIIIDDVIMSNAMGQQVLKVKSPNSKIDVSSLQSGLYLITFRANGEMWTSKVVKE